MVVEAWLARAAARGPSTPRCGRRAGSWSYGELRAAARAGAARAGRRAARAAAARRDRAARRGSSSPRRCTRACCWARSRCRWTCACRPPSAQRIDRGCGAARRRAAAAARRRAPAWRAGRRHATTSTRTAVVIHTSGTTAAPRPVELTYGNLLWSALGSAVALGPRPRASAGCARCRSSHVGGLSILLRSAIYATTAVVHERFETDRVLDGAARRAESTLVSLVATTLARLLDAGLERPPALRCALTGGGPVPAALVRARARGGRAGEPHLRAHRGLLAGHHDAGRRARRPAPTPRAPGRHCSAPACRSPPTGRSWSRGPPSRRRRSRGRWLHTGDLGALDDGGRLRVSGRKADTIISGGENVAPAEVEAVLEAHPRCSRRPCSGRGTRGGARR